MDLLKEKRSFLNKKGVSLAVLSAIFLGIFLFGIYFYFDSGNLTGKTISENLFGKSEIGVTGNVIGTLSEENPSCVGTTKNFACGDTITESCTMNGNIFLDSEIGLPCFEFGNDDLTLDCNGYGIFTNPLEYSNPNPMGIFSFSKKGISIFNCTFSGFVFGAYFHNSSSLNLVGNNFSSNYYGMVLSSSNEGIFEENAFSQNIYNYRSGEIYDFYTLRPIYGGPATFQTQFHTGIGAHIYNSSNNSFFNNSLMGNNKEGFSLILSNNNSFFKNSIFYGGDSGFYLERSEENNFTSNRAGFNQMGFSSLYLNKNNSLFGNTFCSNNYKDIYYGGSSLDFGDENYCNSTSNWNDINTEGCTYSCAQEQCVNNWVYGEWGECVDYGFNSIRERDYYDSNFCFTQSVTPYFNEECTGKCLGKTSSFSCGDFVTESCYFGSDIYSTSFSPNYACFLISSDDIVIDCNGNSLKLFGGVSEEEVYYGIYSSVDNFTLNSCNLEGFPIGVNLGSNSSINDSSFSNSFYGGIWVSSSENKIINNTINDSGTGIYLKAGSHYNNISFNLIYNMSDSGIVGENSLNNYLERNNVYNNSIYDIFVNLSLNNIGIDNACCGFSVWNDSGFEGCTYSTCLEELISPEVKITYPVSNGAYSSISYLFYSTSGADFDRCWYSSNGGETNSSSVLANVGQFYYPFNLGDLTYTFTPTIYCNTTSGEVFNDSIKFLIGSFNSAREVDKLLASDGAASYEFGYSVSISGDYAIVGAPYEDSAYIFKKNSTGQFEEINKINSSDGAASDYFGYSVSISGDYAIVGASKKENYLGSAYIFKKNETGQFEEVNKLLASDGEEGDSFGYSVSISGDYAIVGANKYNNSKGSAYIFKKNETGQFEEVNKLLASDGEEGDSFGSSVSISGDYAIVGAYGDDDKGSYSGSAYIFKKNETGQFVEVNKIIASDGVASDEFGISVSISGKYAIIGANYGDEYNGSAYIFKKNSSDQFEFVNKIVAPDGAYLDTFGSSVSISGDYAIVGADGESNIRTITTSGSAYIFKKNSSDQFVFISKFNKSEGEFYDDFGNSVSISGDYAIVGVPGDNNSIGSAYVYNLYQCIPSLKNTTESNWTNISCLESNLMNQSRNWIEYDENNCNEVANVTYVEYNVSEYCDYSFYSSCIENWSCTDWSSCVGGIQNRTCTDLNSCLSILHKPNESQFCSVNKNSPSGGSPSRSNTIRLDFTSSFIKRSNNLEKGDKIEFFLKDSSLHKLEFDRISGNRAYFTIRSDPVSFNLGAGEEKYLDLNKDGENDFYIKVESISSNKVSVLTQSIKSDSPIVDDSSHSNEESAEEIPFIPTIIEDIFEEMDPTKRRVFFISAISILIVGLLVVLYFIVSLMIKNSQEKKHSLREEVKKLIEQGNSFVYSGKKGEALSSYEKARKIFEANKEHCGGLFSSLKNLYDSILRMK